MGESTVSIWNKTERANKAFYLLVACTLALLAFVPGLSFADSPFSNVTNNGSSDILNIVTPIVAIAVMVVGLACLFGRISWWWFVGVVIGVICVYGKDQIVSWIRGLAGI
ncbi:transposase [Salmonella enterica]|uniref:TrbC/VirB2 family protein n=1 Tax=Pantoea stewartii TaxID=66269 RepID=UPI00107D25DE|nr:TrbC/VirB2 family protein [Pantoea stewartii]EAB4047392.1 transposase [Salmonella enterica]EAQ0915988.1 transposase [Salmonella enterica]EJW9057429.1 TrbC/VirB2 family protein [Salmonella enterica]ELA5548112.1 TrbC/VirB2 family protein [Salmonella enterica]ELE3839919.1 TrbC/VirB2 family protein [Salmonella enterica]